MKLEISLNTILILVVLALVIVFIMMRCTFSCGGKVEQYLNDSHMVNFVNDEAMQADLFSDHSRPLHM